jgi:hypothetical protein
MTTEGKRPSELIGEIREDIARNVLATPGFHLLSGIGQAHASVTAVVHYLDAEHERRAAWEKEQEEQVSDLQQRLEAVEGLVVP